MLIKKLTAYKQLFTVLSFISFFTACTKAKNENRAPEAFTVTVSNATSTGATINWTAAKDPENEAVTYAIEWNGQQITNNLSATSYTAQNLIINTNYSGKITASDASGNSTTATFTFNTSDAPTPSDFALKIDNSSNKSIAFSWTASTLPANEPVLYDVYIDNNLKVSGITQTTFAAAQLSPKTMYKIKVVAKSQSGKSIEKGMDAETADNTAPANFLVEEQEHGFSYIKIKWNGPAEVDNDSLSYFLNRNGVITPLTESPDNNFYSIISKGLGASTAYALTIIAKDPYGAESSSNTLNITTKNGPENSFAFETKNDGSNVVLEWNQLYPVPFNTAHSSYFINGVEKSLSQVQVNFTDMGNGVLNCKAFLNATDFPANISQPVKLLMNWGPNESPTQSRIINYTRYVYSPTTAEANLGIIKRYSNGDHGFILTFKNDIISDYPEWTVKEVKFENMIAPGSISLQFASGRTVQSVFGTLLASDFEILKSKSEGYIIIQDEGGFHRITFNFTAL
jgi:fibronectin type 3 domain-containing protein